MPSVRRREMACIPLSPSHSAQFVLTYLALSIRHVQRATHPYASRLGCTRLIQLRVVGRFRLDDTDSRTQATTSNLQTCYSLDSQASHQRTLACATDRSASSSTARYASSPTLEIKEETAPLRTEHIADTLRQRHQLCHRYYQQSLLRLPW
jgi:hypothetical protein